MAEQPADAQLSEDGQWWWDGADWQPVAGPQASYDPNALQPDQLSDDGQWRWDGSEWQPVGDAAVPLPDDLRDEMANFAEYYPEIMALASVDTPEDWLVQVVGVAPEDIPTDEPMA
jgi:hypothetical protein